MAKKMEIALPHGPREGLCIFFAFLYGMLVCYSVRLGVFLRRYPVARVFVILYMVSHTVS